MFIEQSKRGGFFVPDAYALDLKARMNLWWATREHIAAMLIMAIEANQRKESTS